MSFAEPNLLWLLVLLPLAAWPWFGRRRGQRHPLAQAMPAAAGRLLAYRGLPALGLAGLACLVVAWAGPRSPETGQDEPRSGVGVMMVLDRSGSMGSPVGIFDDHSRLDLVKDAFSRFVDRRPHDLIGLIAFARYPETLAPLSAAPDTLKEYLDAIDLAQDDEDGTAIGDALALAVARLKAAGPELKSRVVVLLTDGLSNAGAVAPMEAARQAAAAGVRIYAIGFGAQGYRANADDSDPNTLAAMAKLSGGQFYGADSAQGLERVCAQIDALEKAPLKAPSRQRYREHYGAFALAGLLLVLLEQTLALTWLRRLES